MSVRPRPSLVLLNIYYFRLKIFKKGTFKELLEKKDTFSENLGVGQTPSPPSPRSGWPVQNVKVTLVEKILKNVDVADFCYIYIHLANITNLSLKLVTFSLKFKIAKIKLFFKEAIKNEDKSIHDQTQDYLQRNELLYIYHSEVRVNHSIDTCLS